MFLALFGEKDIFANLTLLTWNWSFDLEDDFEFMKII